MPMRDDDSLRPYLNAIGRKPLLTADEEIFCGKAIQAAKPLRELERPLTRAEKRVIRQADRAKERFITGNLRLVVTIAKRYAGKCTFLTILDLIQEGSIGLARAADLYDPSRGYKFSTYCYWWIRQSMYRAMHNTERTIRRPVTVCELAGKLPKIMASETTRLGRPPTRAEIAKVAKVTEAEIELLAQRGSQPYSLDALYAQSHKTSLIEHVADPNSLDQNEIDEMLNYDLQSSLFQACMDKLNDNERNFIIMRYGLDGQQPRTLKEIGDTFSLSRERVRQVTDRASRKLRVVLRQHGLGLDDTHITTEPYPETGAPSFDAIAAQEVEFAPPPISHVAPVRQYDSSPCEQSTAA